MSVDPKILDSNQSKAQNGQEPDLKELLAKNIELSEQILKSVKYIKRYIFWQKIFGIIKILIIVVPLVFGYIVLAPHFNKAIQQYQELLDLKEKAANITTSPVNIDLNELNKLKKIK